MRKNIEQVLLFTTAILFMGLMLGILIGRFTSIQTIVVQNQENAHSTHIQPTTNHRNDSYGKININTASVEELSMLPGVGKTYAERIVEHRLKYGLFLSVDDLLNIKGIGEKKLESMKPYITVGG